MKKLLEKLIDINNSIETQEAIKNDSPLYLGFPKDMFPMPIIGEEKSIQIRTLSLYSLDKEEKKSLVDFCKQLWLKKREDV